MSGLVTPESLSREGSPIPDYVDSGATSPLHPLNNTAANYDINTAPPSPPHSGGYYQLTTTTLNPRQTLPTNESK